MLDSTVLGNLMNFPKHIFGMPFGGYATDGNEGLSLVLYSHKQKRAECKGSGRGRGLPATQPTVLFVTSPGGATPPAHLTGVARRLGMSVQVVAHEQLSGVSGSAISQFVAVLTGFESTVLPLVAKWASSCGLPMHLHVLDSEWRRVFAKNSKPVRASCLSL